MLDGLVLFQTHTRISIELVAGSFQYSMFVELDKMKPWAALGKSLAELRVIELDVEDWDLVCFQSQFSKSFWFYVKESMQNCLNLVCIKR